MLARLNELSPAKINLFLKIINKRKDGYHNIRSGVTLINLFDEVTAEKNSKFEVRYSGEFAPLNNKFQDCIVTKFFSDFKLDKPNYRFTIKKNIPIQSGLGSASSNLAAVIRILNKLGNHDKNFQEYVKIGADVPFFLKNSDCLMRGIGNILTNHIFPKYYFLLVKPKTNCSTSNMYKYFKIKDINFNIEDDINEITENDYGNDFESHIEKNYKEIALILNYLRNLPNVIFSRLTGSGSCIFAAFESKKNAEKSSHIFKEKFPNLWFRIVENNF
tara:strand:- start:1041 stop:1862 length:822 start_codon:yes stop_codon:yes gene_type:complete